METALLILVGCLGGTLLMRWAMERGLRRGLEPHHFDEAYQAARRAVLEHFRVHGTLNRVQLEHLTDIPRATAARYLVQLERDGILRSHEHRGRGAFYTRA